MKKLIFSFLLIFSVIIVRAQADRASVLKDLEKNHSVGQDISATATATVKTSTRLFGDKNDLTSVITIIPEGTKVAVLDSDSTYLHVVFEDNEGYIFRRHAVIEAAETAVVPNEVQSRATNRQEQPVRDEGTDRFSYLENKYGSTMAVRLAAGKIWKGMNSDMVKDSWGNAERINRVVNNNLIKEEWIYRNTWLYFENNILTDWGPTKK
jgi:hypothetical protein